MRHEVAKGIFSGTVGVSAIKGDATPGYDYIYLCCGRYGLNFVSLLSNHSEQKQRKQPPIMTGVSRNNNYVTGLKNRCTSLYAGALLFENRLAGPLPYEGAGRTDEGGNTSYKFLWGQSNFSHSLSLSRPLLHLLFDSTYYHDLAHRHHQKPFASGNVRKFCRP
jgi:hypothetical protein